MRRERDIGLCVLGESKERSYDVEVQWEIARHRYQSVGATISQDMELMYDLLDRSQGHLNKRVYKCFEFALFSGFDRLFLLASS